MEDPFELDQQSLDAQMKLLQDSLDRWRRIKSGADEFTTADELAAAEDEFNWLTNEIQKSVKSIGWELNDLEETLRRMSDGKRQSRGGAARTRYLRDARSLLATVEAEVKAGGGVDVAEAEDGQTPGQLQRLQQPINTQEPPMSASTERLVESLFQPDEEDDDVELLIQDDYHGGQRQFSVLSPDTDEETPLRRFWRRHRPAMLFVILVVALLFLVLIISASTSKGSQHEAPFTSTIQTTTFAPKEQS